MSKWIECSERMPEEFEDVLVSDGSNVEVMWLGDSGRWYSALSGSVTCDGEITHWMPLPEPPSLV